MSKICPNCQTEFDDSHGFCSNCGSRLVDNYGSVDPVLNLGDANAISGGVNINQSKNITSHDTHYHSTTVHERSKSESELKLDATNQLREKAEEIMAERGRIDSVAMSQLRPLATHLGIDDESFKTIIKDVRSNRNGSASGLSAANARYLQQAQQAVQTNDMDGLSNLTPRLEAMAAISQDDNVQYLYYLTLSLLYPIKSMEVYERQTDENYWRSFWAIISYIRTGKYAEATKTLALFDPLRYEKSEDDQNLLEAYFNIMREDKDGAQEFLDEILGEPTELVKPLLRAVESTLYEEEAESLEVRFYMERVLTKSDVVVKSQKKIDAPIATEEPAKTAPKPEKESQPATGIAPTPEAPRTNKESGELYAKACAASGAKRVMLLQKAADAGSLDAMFDLSDCYYDGDGVEKNISLAIKWMTKAADAGYIKAQTALGATYFQGMEGLDQNYALSEKYLMMAAEKDNVDAQAFISYLYIAMEEYDKAMLWARKASQMEHPQAYFALGRIYDEGLGVETNHLEGLKWFEKAAKGGDADAQNMVGNIYLNADYVKHDEKKAFEYYQMAAAQGHLWGMCNLGYCYQEGIGTDMNILSAEEWLRKAAEGGLQDAQNMLNENSIYSASPLSDSNMADFVNTEELLSEGDAALKGKKYKEAYSLYDQALQNGDANASERISAMVELGMNQSQNQKFKEAVEILTPLSEGGVEEAQFHLAGILVDGQNLGKSKNKYINYKKGLELLHSLSSKGNLRALTNIGWCYENGHGYKVDYQEALNCYKKALDNGYIKDDWISERINSCEIMLAGPGATIEKVWVDCDGVKEVTVHCDWIINNLKGGNAQIKLIIDKKTGSKKVQKEYIYTVFDIEYESTLNNTFFTLQKFEMDLQHDREETFGFRFEISQLNDMYLPEKLLLKSKEMSFTTWNFFNFLSKNKLEIRDQKI